MKSIEPIIPDIPNNRNAQVVKMDIYILLEPPNGLRFTCAANRSGAVSGGSAG